MPREYWVLHEGEVTGPFSGDQLKQMAAADMILAADMISTDQVNWQVAAQVKGLFQTERPAEGSGTDSPEPSVSAMNDRADHISMESIRPEGTPGSQSATFGLPARFQSTAGGLKTTARDPRNRNLDPAAVMNTDISGPPDVHRYIGGWLILLAISISCCLVVSIGIFVWCCWAIFHSGYHDGVGLWHFLSCTLSFLYMCLVVFIVVNFFRKRGIGGWLIFPAIGLSCWLVVTVYKFILFLDDLFYDLVRLGKVDEWDIVVCVFSSLYTCLVAVVAISFFARKKYAPKCIITLLNVNIVVSSVPLLLFAGFAPMYYIAAGMYVLIAAIWVPYFLVSERVKKTFVR